MRRSSKDERRRGVYWLVAGAVFLGTHDAQTLPLLRRSIPLLIGASIW